MSLWSSYLLFGTPDDFFYCIDTANGKEVWRRPAAPHPNRGSVVDANGVVYYASQQRVLYARRVHDGSEVWTRIRPNSFNSAPSLDGDGRLFIGNGGNLLAYNTATGAIRWEFPVGGPKGTFPVESGRVYVDSSGLRTLFCVDTSTGEEIWSFDTEFVNVNAAIGADGTIYVLASGGQGWLFAITPDGEERWRYPITDRSLNHPAIVDAAGNVYFCTYAGNTLGWVHAVGADGGELWVRQMPNQVSASPTLAPDGTLYVICRDKHLYAFKDPVDCPADIDNDGDVGFLDLAAVLGAWGPCNGCPQDIDESGIVDFDDLLVVLTAWGPCE